MVLIYINLIKNIKKYFWGIIIFVVVTIFYCGLVLLCTVYDNENIGMYSKSSFDYIFQAISASQITEYEDNAYVDIITPFKAIAEMEIQSADRLCDGVGVIAFDEDVESVLENTFFSDGRLINKTKLNENGNLIYIDYYISDYLELKPGDEVWIEWGEKCEKIGFTVAAIYESTAFADRHTVILANEFNCRFV